MAHRQTNYINKHATACRLYSTQSVLGFWRLRASLSSASVLGSRLDFRSPSRMLSPFRLALPLIVLGSPRLLRFLRCPDVDSAVGGHLYKR